MSLLQRFVSKSSFLVFA